MSKLRFAVLLGATLCSVSPFSNAQQNRASDRLLMARSLYYTPTSNGLASFQCSVGFDWKDFFARINAQDIPDDNPMLVYLKATKLSVLDLLHGKGLLNWANDSTIPDGKDASVKQLREGMLQVFDGYFQTWNAYMNGTMVPAPDATTIVTPDGEGVILHSKSKGYDVTEKFDKNMLLTDQHVITADADIESYPIYIDSPEGRIISTIRSLYRQPVTAPAMEINVTTTYSKVGQFQLPSSIRYEVKNVTTLDFTLTNCEAKTNSNPAIKP